MSAPPYKVKAVFDYASPHDDDLNFPNGQIITVTEEEDEDWYYGEYTDASGVKKGGIFPRNFVERYEPETPPRPSRSSRPNKEAGSTPGMTTSAPAEGKHGKPEQDERTNEPVPPPEVPQSTGKHTESSEPSPNAKLAATANLSRSPEPSQAVSATKAATKPSPQADLKTPAPAVAEKPTGGSFRDRIAAFNKPAAPPIAPPKPGGSMVPGGSSFIKKPFIAPPPSRDAYVPTAREVPPQKIYRKEDPELMEHTSHNVQPVDRSAQPVHEVEAEGNEPQPKPTSLKDRIALLQKQQMEQAARHAEVGHKKEKPKRPPKKRVESQEDLDTADTEDRELQRMDSGETMGKQSIDSNHDDGQPSTRSSTRRYQSKEGTQVTSPMSVPRELLSDANDADQSGAGDTEDAGDLSTGRDDSDEKPRTKASAHPSRSFRTSTHEADPREEKEDTEEEEVEEDERDEVDPEVKRRMEIRERMAKMSGGMGMAGMFGPPGSMPMPGSGGTKSQKGSGSSERKMAGSQGTQAADLPSTSIRAPPIPVMPMPGMQKVQSPEEVDRQLEVEKDDTTVPSPITQRRAADDIPDVEDLEEEPQTPARTSGERILRGPPVSQDRPVPVPPPTQGRGPPPAVPVDRPVPLPPSAQSRPVPPPPTSMPMSPTAGPESDTEMSQVTQRLSLMVPSSDNSRPGSRDAPPYVPTDVGRYVPGMPSRPAGPRPPESGYVQRESYLGSETTSPTSPITPGSSNKRSSRVPPIPSSSPSMKPPSHTRGPPPPPPTAAPPRHQLADDGKAYDAVASPSLDSDSEEEITAYEGDYDTDIAPGASHKDALKSHGRDVSMDNSITTDDTYLRSPVSGPPPLPSNFSPRAVPPLPPSIPPKSNRRSAEIPRAPPPPVPPPKEQPMGELNDEYDSNKYLVSRQDQRVGSGQIPSYANPPTPKQLDDYDDDLYSTSPPRRSMPPPPPAPTEQQEFPSPQTPSQFVPPPGTPSSSRTMPRQSLDVQRMPSNARRSMDQPHPSGEHGFIAADVDLAQLSQWWAQPNRPPPVFQNRQDVIYEMEESSSSKRGGKTTSSKDVYVLFMDYSQTVITARFDPRDPAEASLEQRHEPPPARLRQDQLENAHSQFGARISSSAESKQNTVVGDGSPHSLLLDLFKPLSNALLPVGTRAYGALIYANLANASIQQYDEIRAGDIVTFRNAKFQGHRGTMHQKYNVDVGKPDHVGVVYDWDGTKKKVRAWEQGRESRKVKMESFKLGDLRSGEVKVWRVMARAWVGWEGQN
ncbi:MAG: hypothetical protein M1830_002263 [Pleopsidium flavum]|nr:MAG: hypothetical protein M1830_002263 [Pleopsidium flavum]